MSIHFDIITGVTKQIVAIPYSLYVLRAFTGQQFSFGFRTLPKIAVDFRGRPEDISIKHQRN